MSESIPEQYINFVKTFASENKKFAYSQEVSDLLRSLPQLLVDLIMSSVNGVVGKISKLAVLSPSFKNPQHPELGGVDVSILDYTYMPDEGEDLMKKTIQLKDRNGNVYNFGNSEQELIDAYLFLQKLVQDLIPTEKKMESNNNFEDKLLSLNNSLPPSLQQSNPNDLIEILKVIFGGSFAASQLFK